MRSWLVALGVGFAVSACLVEPEHVLACGDGYVDALVGEECDPNDRSSYIGVCVGTSRPFGEGDCDPDSCEIVCEACGNGVLDPAEAPGGFVAPYPCAGNAELAPLHSPYPEKPYTFGIAVACLERCKFDRSSCRYCGDGVQDGPLQVSIGDTPRVDSLPELCDGDEFDPDALADAQPICAELGAQANVACNADCLGVTPRDGDLCCVSRGLACPTEDDGLRCCHEYAHPEIEDACLPVLIPSPPDDGGNGAFTCR